MQGAGVGVGRWRLFEVIEWFRNLPSSEKSCGVNVFDPYPPPQLIKLAKLWSWDMGLGGSDRL